MLKFKMFSFTKLNIQKFWNSQNSIKLFAQQNKQKQLEFTEKFSDKKLSEMVSVKAKGK